MRPLQNLILSVALLLWGDSPAFAALPKGKATPPKAKPKAPVAAEAELPRFPHTRLPEIGDSGHISQIKIVQVIDAGNAIADFGWEHRFIRPDGRGKPEQATELKHETVWLKAPTAGMVDGRMGALGKGKIVQVTGTTTYKTATASKTVLVFEVVDPAEKEGPMKVASKESGKPETNATDKPEPKASADGPKAIASRWINTSYDTTIYQVKDKEWAELNNKTKKVQWTLVETGRTDEYVELYNETRKQTWRVSAKRMDMKVGDKWEWISNGKWEAPP